MHAAKDVMDNPAFENSYYRKIIKEVGPKDTDVTCIASAIQKIKQ